jgi:hypothetical protein
VVYILADHWIGRRNVVKSFLDRGTEDIFNVCFVWSTDGPEQVEIADYHCDELS